MKDYEYKMRTLMIKQQGRCKSCNKLFVPGDKIDLAHKVKAGKFNYERYGEDVIDHLLNLAATHSGKCNDKQNRSRAAHPVESKVLINSIKNSIINES